MVLSVTMATTRTLIDYFITNKDKATVSINKNDKLSSHESSAKMGNMKKGNKQNREF